MNVVREGDERMAEIPSAAGHLVVEYEKAATSHPFRAGSVCRRDSEMLRLAAEGGVKRIRVHAFLDGRDTPPRSAMKSIEAAESVLRAIAGSAIATVSGRFFAMDRDKRWDRIEKAYRAMVSGEGPVAPSPSKAAFIVKPGRLTRRCATTARS